jgi:hypothetical protein
MTNDDVESTTLSHYVRVLVNLKVRSFHSWCQRNSQLFISPGL